jgi:PAH dioxygenase large subunit
MTLAESVRPQEGVVPTRIFIEDEIHEQELRNVFARSWLFVGHETEVPSKGDYVVRWMAHDSVIMTRGEDMEIRVLLNQCRHRGMQVCRAELGNASHFRCPYHGWIYRNTGKLAGVPLYKDVYGSNLKIEGVALREPRVERYRGMVFACWDESAPSLGEYLGDARWYLGLIFGRTDAGLEVIGPPQRWVADMNWKLGADNFCGDGYHVWTLHRHAYEMGVIPDGVRNGHVISTPHGHGIRIQNTPEDSPTPEYIGMADELKPMLERNLDEAQRQAIRKCVVVHGNLFPNLSFVYSFGAGEPTDPPVNFVNVRLWQPTAAGQSEIWSWFMVDRARPRTRTRPHRGAPTSAPTACLAPSTRMTSKFGRISRRPLVARSRAAVPSTTSSGSAWSPTRTGRGRARSTPPTTARPTSARSTPPGLRG